MNTRNTAAMQAVRRELVGWRESETAELMGRVRFGDGAVSTRSTCATDTRASRLRKVGVAVPYLRRPFTPEEDAALMDGVSLAVLAEETGRFVQALSRRRRLLRERSEDAASRPQYFVRLAALSWRDGSCTSGLGFSPVCRLLQARS